MSSPEVVLDVVLIFWVGWCVWQIVKSVIDLRREHGHRKARRDRDNSDLAARATRIAELAARSARATAALTVIARTVARLQAPTSGTDSGLKETTADIPIIAFKRATLGWTGETFVLLNAPGQVVQLDDDARCLFTELGPDPHACPVVECMCGFHAVKSPSAITRSYGNVLMTVELSGRVLVAEHGYRAQHQRVLSIHPPPCAFCAKDTPATGVAVGIPATEKTMAGLLSFLVTEGPPSFVASPRCENHRTIPAAEFLMSPRWHRIEDVLASVGFPYSLDPPGPLR